MQSVRGAVNRCFNLIDTPADRSQRLFLPPATTSSRRVPVGVRATQPKEEILK
jgi:hypothetical protein